VDQSGGLSGEMMRISMTPLAGCAAFMTIALPQLAAAADLGASAEPGPAYAAPYSPPPFDGYYLRLDVGAARSESSGFSQADLSANGGRFVSESLGTQPVLAIGIGRQISPWIRTDLTGEYRVPSSLGAYDNLTATLISNGEILQANTTYRGEYSSLVGLANVYFDLGHWRGFTPYVGAGIGAARNKISDFTTATIGSLTDPHTGKKTSQATSATSPDHSSWNLAWALMAGVSFDVTDATKLDVGYRYIDLGSGEAASSDVIYCRCGAIGQPLKLHDLTANEIRIGLRFQFGGPENADRPPPLK
jgi:opacity protein-like surface antigen